jgi:hypothetical protein
MPHKKKPRFTVAGASIYWTVYDNGEKIATLMRQDDAEAVRAKLQKLADEITTLHQTYKP